MAGLVLILVLTVILGYVASTAQTLSTEMRNLQTEGDKSANQVRGDIGAVMFDLERLMSDDKTKTSFDGTKSTLDQDLINISLPADTASKVSRLREHLQDLSYDTDTMYQKGQAISSITTGWVAGFNTYY
jgi:hypothetical protein